MACSAQSVTLESYLDETAVSSAYATPSEETALVRDRRRRHSFHAARKLSCDYDADAVFLRVLISTALSSSASHPNDSLGGTVPGRIRETATLA